jgi:hypothetical protein
MTRLTFPQPRLAPLMGLATLAALSLSACGPNHHLEDFSFAERSMGLVYIAPPRPVLLTGSYDLASSKNPLEAVVRAGSGVAKEVEGRKANARLDSASARVDVAGQLAQRTLERASRYLGTRPVPTQENPDFLIEVHMRRFGIDASGSGAAYLFTNADAVLLDRRTGREIWSIAVRGTDRITPSVRNGSDHLPAAILTAGSLSAVTVDDFQQALDQLMTLSSNLIADELRAALRESREK